LKTWVADQGGRARHVSEDACARGTDSCYASPSSGSFRAWALPTLGAPLSQIIAFSEYSEISRRRVADLAMDGGNPFTLAAGRKRVSCPRAVPDILPLAIVVPHGRGMLTCPEHATEFLAPRRCAEPRRMSAVTAPRAARVEGFNSWLCGAWWVGLEVGKNCTRFHSNEKVRSTPLPERQNFSE
jgi:hypothetical protein